MVLLQLSVIIWNVTGWEDKCLDSKESVLITFLIGGIIGHYSYCNDDTWSSEIGVLSDDQPRLITTFKVDSLFILWCMNWMVICLVTLYAIMSCSNLVSTIEIISCFYKDQLNLYSGRLNLPVFPFKLNNYPPNILLTVIYSCYAKHIGYTPFCGSRTKYHRFSVGSNPSI